MPYYAGKLQEAYSLFRIRSGEWLPYKGCWVEVRTDQVGVEGVILMTEDGDYYLLEKSDFKKRNAPDPHPAAQEPEQPRPISF